MRLNRATRTLIGAAAAAAVATLSASPAWACHNSDAPLQLHSFCGPNGQPTWMVHNPNANEEIPFAWVDDQRHHSQKLWVSGNGSVTLSTHATKVVVIAYRNDRDNFPKWDGHGVAGAAHCSAPKPPPSKKPKPSHAPTHSASPTHSAAPAPASPAPTGEARPATPVKAQPNFTG